MIPLSYAQQRLWFLQQLEQAGATYHIPVMVRLAGTVDVPALDAALTDVVTRHESLRTVFPTADDRPYQRVVSARSVLTTAPATDLDAQVSDAAARPFDLARDLPIRAFLFSTSASEHVLLIVTHHIASDDGSTAPFFRDLSTAYTARIRGTEPAYEPLPVQYTDFALWQRENLGDESDPTSVVSREADFWRDHLADLPDGIDLPFDRPRPPVASYRGDDVGFTVDAAVHARLAALARDCHCSVFMLVHGALAALLRRLGAGADVAIGATLAGRTDEALHDLVGFFVNTLVLRTDVSGDPTFRELLACVRDADLAAFAHQELPFDRLVDIVNPPRSAARHPLFQVMLAFQDPREVEIRLPGLTVLDRREIGTGTAKFDLSFSVRERPDAGGLTGVLEFATDLFDRSSAVALAERFVRWLDRVSATPDVRLGTVDLVTEKERDLLLGTWNDTAIAPAPDRPVAEMFDARVRLSPGAVAVHAGAEELTYAQLSARVDRLARVLIACGVGHEVCVGVLMARSVDVIVASLAVLKAGGVYVPLHAQFPDDRLAFVLDDTAALLVLADAAMGARADGLTRPVVRIDNLPDAPGDVVWPTVDPRQLAYVMFTSGSTGVPKGVAARHCDVVAFTADRRWREPAHRRALMHSPHSFDASTYEIFVPLLSGGTVVVAPPGELSVDDLSATIADGRVTAVFMTSSLFAVMAQENPRAFAAVAEVWTGGDALSPTAIRTVLRLCPGTTVFDVYGPTETTTYATCYPMRDAIGVPGSVPIGRALDNMRLYIVDDQARLVPPGVVGEMYIAGAGLARGYLGRPALTASRFVADPYAADGTRMYRTGDLVRWRHDGQVEFVGRVDQQVKVRGFRVELGEIETVLLREPSLAQVVVLARKETTGNRRLVAYVVPASDDVDVDRLRADAVAALPDYMVPAAFVVLDALPLTRNGKIDRAALPEPSFDGHDGGREPATEVERILCDQFTEVLGVAHVGLDDSFFDLGGDSIMSIQLVSRSRRAGVGFTPRDVFQHRTVAALSRIATTAIDAPVIGTSAALTGLRDAEIAEVTRGIDGPVADVLPLSPLQEGLLFHAVYDAAGVDVYTVQTAVHLAGAVDGIRLRHAMAHLVARHPNLGACFRHTGETRPVAIVPAEVAVPWTETDVTDVAGWLAADRARRFDMATPPLLRCALLRTGPGESVFVLTFHHALLDGWSLPVLLDELMAVYADDALPPATPYRRYLEWLSARDVGAARATWVSALGGVEPLLVAGPAAGEDTFPGRSERHLPARLSETVREFARRRGLTINTVMQGAWAQVLATLSGRQDVVFGATVSGRPAEVPGIETMVGLFINTVPVRVRFTPGERVGDFLTRLQSEQAALLDVQFLGLAEIQQALGSRRLFDTSMVVESYPGIDRPGDAAGVRVTGRDDYDAVHYPLGLIVELGDDISLTLSYRRDLFDAAAVDAIADRIVRHLEQITADPDVRMADVDLLIPAERERIDRWNGTAAPAPAGRCFQDLFEARVRRTPDAIAVSCGTEERTYADLNARANRMARWLVGRGVGAETLVALRMPNSIDLITAILGVAKTGGAYLPVDLSTPADRVTRMFADAAPSLLLTTVPGEPIAGVPAVDIRDATVADLPGTDLTDADRLRPADPAQLAYVIFTSGSTGVPKGVAVSHNGIADLVASQGRRFGIGPGSRVLQFASPSFDAAFAEISVTLCAGGTLVVADRDEMRSGAGLPEVLRGGRVSQVTLPPTVLGALPDDALPPGSTIVVAGEQCAAPVAARWSVDHTMRNAYGPTETTVCATVSEPLSGAGVPPIGAPISNTRAYVLDAFLRPVPPGAIGELYVAGAGLARGYLARPALTGSRFVADPVHGGGTRMYRTGDLARWTRRRPDGVRRPGRRSGEDPRIPDRVG